MCHNVYSNLLKSPILVRVGIDQPDCLDLVSGFVLTGSTYPRHACFLICEIRRKKKVLLQTDMVRIKYLEQYLQAGVISVLSRQKNCSKFKASLVYINSEFQIGQGYTEKKGKQCLQLNIRGHNERVRI